MRPTRKDLQYLAAKIAHVINGNDEGAEPAEPREDHDPETCEICDQVAQLIAEQIMSATDQADRGGVQASVRDALVWWETELRLAGRGRHSESELEVIRTSISALKAALQGSGASPQEPPMTSEELNAAALLCERWGFLSFQHSDRVLVSLPTGADWITMTPDLLESLVSKLRASAVSGAAERTQDHP